MVEALGEGGDPEARRGRGPGAAPADRLGDVDRGQEALRRLGEGRRRSHAGADRKRRALAAGDEEDQRQDDERGSDQDELACGHGRLLPPPVEARRREA